MALFTARDCPTEAAPPRIRPPTALTPDPSISPLRIDTPLPRETSSTTDVDRPTWRSVAVLTLDPIRTKLCTDAQLPIARLCSTLTVFPHIWPPLETEISYPACKLARMDKPEPRFTKSTADTSPPTTELPRTDRQLPILENDVTDTVLDSVT